jgi:hypothetical protein
MAALDLLSDVAAEAPLLVSVDDAHRLDRPSADVLAFVARRIESDPIVLVAAARDGHPSPLTDAGLPEHTLGALDAATATALLEASGPHVTAAARSRLLREAAGNPLALTELPLAGHPGSLRATRCRSPIASSGRSPHASPSSRTRPGGCSSSPRSRTKSASASCCGPAASPRPRSSMPMTSSLPPTPRSSSSTCRRCGSVTR